MNNQTETHIHTCLLLNTGELISMREAEQRAAAEAGTNSAKAQGAGMAAGSYLGNK